MQALDEVDVQSSCRRLLDLDEGIFYSSFLDSFGSIVGEAMKDSIAVHDKLSIMILPVKSRNGSLVLATTTGSNLVAIIEKTKNVLKL